MLQEFSNVKYFCWLKQQWQHICLKHLCHKMKMLLHWLRPVSMFLEAIYQAVWVWATLSSTYAKLITLHGAWIPCKALAYCSLHLPLYWTKSLIKLGLSSMLCKGTIIGDRATCHHLLYHQSVAKSELSPPSPVNSIVDPIDHFSECWVENRLFYFQTNPINTKHWHKSLK